MTATLPETDATTAARTDTAPAPGWAGRMPDADREFVTGGHAIFTADNGRGSWYTFLVERCEGEFQGKPRTTYFVKGLVGSDNSDPRSYRYAGILDPREGRLVLTRKSPAGYDQTAEFKALTWAFDCLWGRKDVTRFGGASVHHEGFCCDCGLRLTTPESIRAGRGPVCRRRHTKAKAAWTDPAA